VSESRCVFIVHEAGRSITDETLDSLEEEFSPIALRLRRNVLAMRDRIGNFIAKRGQGPNRFWVVEVEGFGEVRVSRKKRQLKEEEARYLPFRLNMGGNSIVADVHYIMWDQDVEILGVRWLGMEICDRLSEWQLGQAAASIKRQL